jgi:hypothetical protein
MREGEKEGGRERETERERDIEGEREPLHEGNTQDLEIADFLKKK